MQNTSHAVMAQRTEGKTSLDDFPTPPWATRALVEHAISSKNPLCAMTCLEPACGRGHMSVTLAEYFREVTSSDVFDYSFGAVADFLKAKHNDDSYDWVITNPPFRLAEEFINRSMKIARHGVAMLTRTVFIESVGRYERLFKINPPSRFAQFTERVPMVKGRVDKKASTATGYAWLIWEKDRLGTTQLAWIPACRKALEREGDYQQAPHTDGQGRALSAHKTASAYAGYAKRTMERALSATRKRHAHLPANAAGTEFRNDARNRFRNEDAERPDASIKAMK